MVDTGDPLFDNVHKILGQKHSEGLDRITELALSDRNFLNEVLDGMTVNDKTYSGNCYQIVKNLSENIPLKLYSEWDYFVELLKSHNTEHRAMAVEIIANLTQVDEDERFEELADFYCSQMEGQNLTVARRVATAAGMIARTKPHLIDRFTGCLLRTEKTQLKDKEKIIADAIDSYGVYFDQLEDREIIIEYIRRQLNSKNPEVRNSAEEFLKSHPLPLNL